MKTLHALLLVSSATNSQQVSCMFAPADDYDKNQHANSAAIKAIQEGLGKFDKAADITDSSNFYYIADDADEAVLVDDKVLESLQDKDGADINIMAVPKVVPVVTVINDLNRTIATNKTNKETGGETIH